MTFAQFVAKIADNNQLTKAQSRTIIENVFDTISNQARKESVKVPGFGTFAVRKYKARMGRNPQTGEAVKIPARKKFRFSPAKSLKESIK